jgi:membrane associated rhomboid family serine protease
VGVQCVDCVREQARTMPSAKTVFGGRVTDRPTVTIAIVVLCVIVWLAQQARPGLTSDISFVPFLGDREPWRFITAAFAHSQSQIMHIGFNMLALWLVGGQYLERLLGAARFAALYLISAIGGSVVYLLLSMPPQPGDNPASYGGSWFTGAVGASGAVFGLFGALIVLNRKLGRSSSGMYATIAINAVIGFVLPGIAWQAHLGGLITGAACAGVIAATSARERRRYQWPGLAGVVVLLVAVAAAKYAVSPTFVF